MIPDINFLFIKRHLKRVGPSETPDARGSASAASTARLLRAKNKKGRPGSRPARPSRPGRGLVPALEHLDEHAHRLLLGRVALGLVEQCEVRVRARVRVG